MAFGSGRAHAATLNVSGGCTLPIAINSVNAGANQSGCTASGSYGSNDTITIPAGTVSITSLTTIVEDVAIQGAGMGSTIISGGGSGEVFAAEGVTISISDLTVTAYREYAIYLEDCDVTLENIEIDGDGAADPNYSIVAFNPTSSTRTIAANNIYLHDIHADDSLMLGFSVHQNGGGTTNANLSNITLADSSNTDGTFDGLALGIGAFGGGFGGTGTVNATITNATLHNLSASGISAPYASFAFASGGTATVNVDVYNSTITGNRGSDAGAPLTGVKSAAFYSAAAGLSGGDVATSTLRVGNSLFADNLTDSDSSNCESADLTSNFSGSGTGTATTSSLGYNISDDATCTSFTQTGDQQNISNIISTLGPLQNNGGNVPTRALLAGSPAISAGGLVLGVTTDARGIVRPGTCPSVGAFQFEGAVCGTSVPTTSGGNAAAPNTGIDSVSSIFAVSASLLGLSIITFVSRKRLTIK